MRADQIARLLPAIYQDALPPDGDDVSSDSVLAALLGVMSVLHASTEQFLGDHRRFIDPWRARPDFLVALAGWVGLGPYLDQVTSQSSEVARFRELTSRAAPLARNRGTAETVLAICEMATGIKGFAIEQGIADENGRPLPFHFRLVAPREAETKSELIRKIVAIEKPCFVTAEIVFRADALEDGDDELPDS